MALNKEFTTLVTGVKASYWKIGDKREDFRGRNLRVQMIGYMNAEVRAQENSEGCMFKEIYLGEGEYSADMTRAQIYSAIKGQEEWSGAVDA